MDESKSDLTADTEQDILFSNFNSRRRKSVGISSGTFKVLRFGSVLHTWTEISKINFLSALTLEDLPKDQKIISSNYLSKTLTSLLADSLDAKNRESILSENFPANLTTLLNEDHLWGCFYNFPELYDDSYSPVVRIRNIQDVPPLEEGVLTRDMVTACLSYLKRTPILGDFVYIKLNLSSKHLVNIDVLQNYKYLVYLDLSCNLLTDLNILSKLPYLQYLNVDCNKLKSVLDYSPPQWFLTEVHYKYNVVMGIQDLSLFWSLTVLDLSHNNIKHISGLQNLRYLRHLDLSFNHIQKLENLNHLRLLWLDISNNNINSFEFGQDEGLWTLLHLEYLNLNENNLASMNIFSGCTRVKELHVRNNQLSMLLELAVYMRSMRRLLVLDLRSNPICTVPGYKDVVINTFPVLLNLDNKDLDPVEQRTSKMEMAPEIETFASRRLLRLLYIEQLSRSRVSQYTPPADTTDVPVVILVGYEAVGKGSLARRLAAECSSNIELARQHTTAFYHFLDHYVVVTRKNFDEMLLDGEFLTYSEMDGESYGLSRKEAFVKDGKVKIVTMDLVGALMLKLRGHRPYLILTSCSDKQALAIRQQERKIARNAASEKRVSVEQRTEMSTLQVLLSGRIIITGILHEILQNLFEYKDFSEFEMSSQCSLMMESGARKQKQETKNVKGSQRIALATSSSQSLIEKDEGNSSSTPGSSIFSLYKQPQGMDEYVSVVYGQSSYQDRQQSKRLHEMTANKDSRSLSNKDQTNVRNEFNKFVSYAGKVGSRKSSKSVTFTSPGFVHEEFEDAEPDPTGMLVKPQYEKHMANLLLKSISAKVIRPQPQNSDLWLAFLLENKLLQTSDSSTQVCRCFALFTDESVLHLPQRIPPLRFVSSSWYFIMEFDIADHVRRDRRSEDPIFMVNQLEHYQKLPSESFTNNIKNDYEEIHLNCPGLFWDTVSMDNPDKAFKKIKTIIKNIVKSQKNLKPMFDIDFANMEHPAVKEKLADICKQIAPHRLFF